MNKHLTRSALLFLLSTTFAQTMVPPAYAQEAYVAAPGYIPAQLQQLVAPIALYPDDLLGEILMASSYPYEVSMAAQWRNANPGLSGDYLTAAVEQQPWDPSVKGLTEFPQVLQMMSSNLDWTERVGEAFLDDQPDVMAAVQQLRRQAVTSGALASGQQMSVADQNGYITIEPADPADVYVPYYNPATVFSPWLYPDYAPYAFGAPDGIVYAPGGYFSYYTPIVVVDVLWGWDSWDWREHRIDFDPRRWSTLDNGQPPPPHNEWQFAPQHRHDVPYKNAALRGRLENPPPVAMNPYRGYQEAAPAPVQRFTPPAQTTPIERPAQISQPNKFRQPDMRQQAARPVAARPARTAPMFESFGNGSAARTESIRGNNSAHPEARPPETKAPPRPPIAPPARNNPPNRPQKGE